jgi:glucokinase
MIYTDGYISNVLPAGAKMDLIGAVDIGGTKIACGLVDARGAVVEQESIPTETAKDYRAGVERIAEMLRLCLSRQPGARVSGVGVGCTGPVDPRSGRIGPNSFLPGWEGVSMVALLEKALGMPVKFENDADAAALGEWMWGAGQGARVSLFVTVSTGIGSGLVVDGHIYRGAGGAHPEIGHMVIEASSGPPCICGARGCWESLASGPAMAAWYNERRSEPQQTAINAEEICRRAAAGQALAREAVLREGYYLGVGLANLINAFAPEVVVLGGGVMGSWSLFEDGVREVLRRSCTMVPLERTALRMASLGPRTGLAGAACVWAQRTGAKDRPVTGG